MGMFKNLQLTCRVLIDVVLGIVDKVFLSLSPKDIRTLTRMDALLCVLHSWTLAEWWILWWKYQVLPIQHQPRIWRRECDPESRSYQFMWTVLCNHCSDVNCQIYQDLWDFVLHHGQRTQPCFCGKYKVRQWQWRYLQ